MANTFEIIPAIDILDGKCVRLTRGKYNKAEEFSTNPLEVAKKWIDTGAKRLHVVDLNGAKEGYPANRNTILDIVKHCKVKIQLGGGIRTSETIEKYLNEGVSFVVLGTQAFKDPEFLKKMLNLYGEKIIVGLDLKNKKIALSGWTETSNLTINELSKYFDGIKQIIYTDISKDGTLTGINLKSIEEVAEAVKSNLIVSGGISSIQDIGAILNLKKQKHPHISGVITGKALYKGMIDLAEVIEFVDKQLC